ncbi:tRNA selenocysteine 1-associated protein 1-like [Argopecten irradians]|uniref:tRNA selenocysteine 1-associated protein 1-like n=1 Tax=Argopecten irradians TaxID=31199 RepID=UPI003712CBEE
MSGASLSLWMGDLEPYMDEYFITSAFDQMGATITSMKLIKNKVTGLPAGYCFIDFSDAGQAHDAMLKLNGKIIPNSSPPKRFKLNTSSHGKEHLAVPEFSLFIGDLSMDVDDYVLYYAFAKKYRSCRSAKVVLENSGRSKGYGFVRFSEETDQQRALIEMQHMTGIGSKPIRVSLATPKRPMPQDMSGGVPYSHYYGHNYPYSPNYYGYYNSHTYYNNTDYNAPRQSGHHDHSTEEDMDALEEPELEVDIFRYNKDYMEQSEEIFEAIELSRWTPLDSISSKITDPVV